MKDPIEAFGDADSIELISRHIERHVGKVNFVLHEIASDYVHVDVHYVAATEDRPFQTLITSGMSDKPMTVGGGVKGLEFAEVAILLPPEWPISEEAFKTEDHYWPVRQLKTLARFPHVFSTWLGGGHTVANGDPPTAFAGSTKMCGAMLYSTISLPLAFTSLRVNDQKTIYFWCVYPLFKEEIDFKLKRNADALWDKFEEFQVSDVLDTQRANVITGRRDSFVPVKTRGKRWWPF